MVDGAHGRQHGADMSANRHADTTPTRHLRSRHGAMSPTWSVSCRRHGADMSACLSFWGEKIPDTTPTLPAKDSTTSSLTAATSTFNKEEGQNDSNQKRPAKLSPDESPSPVRQRKNPLPNFDLRPSDDDSILSGDESDGCEAEEDEMVYFFSEQTRKEDELDNAKLLECSPAACVEEWLELAGENLNDVAAAAAAAAAGGGMGHITKKSKSHSPHPH